MTLISILAVVNDSDREASDAASGLTPDAYGDICAALPAWLAVYEITQVPDEEGGKR